MLPASTFKLFEPLLVLCVKAEKALSIEVRIVQLIESIIQNIPSCTCILTNKFICMLVHNVQCTGTTL